MKLFFLIMLTAFATSGFCDKNIAKFVHPNQLTINADVEYCTSPTIELPAPSVTLCNPTIHTMSLPPIKTLVNLYIHEKSQVTVQGYKCTKLQYSYSADGWTSGGKGVLEPHYQKMTLSECKDAPLKEPQKVSIGSADFWGKKTEYYDPEIIKIPFLALVDYHDFVLIPGALSHPAVTSLSHNEGHNLYYWDDEPIKNQYVSQGQQECYVSEAEYICPKLRIVFHRDDHPKIIEINGRMLEKTREGLYIEVEGKKTTSDITDTSTEQAYINAELEFEDRELARTTLIVEAIKHTAECVNRNYIVSDLDKFDELGMELAESVYGVPNLAVITENGIKRGLTCKTIIVGSVLREGGQMKFLTVDDNSVLYYDHRINALVDEPTKTDAQEAIFKDWYVTGDGLVRKRERTISVKVRKEFQRMKTLKDLQPTVHTIWDRFHSVTPATRSWFLRTWDDVKSFMNTVHMAVFLIGFLVIISVIGMIITPVSRIYLIKRLYRRKNNNKENGRKSSKSSSEEEPLSFANS